MAAAYPEYDFQKCATPWLVKPTNPTDPAIGESARVGAHVAGIVYATHPTDATLAQVLLSGGYGQTVSVSATDALAQGGKIYMVDATTGVRPTYSDVASSNTFVGYALPKDVAAAATAQLLGAGATGNVLVWFRPE